MQCFLIQSFAVLASSPGSPGGLFRPGVPSSGAFRSKKFQILVNYLTGIHGIRSAAFDSTDRRPLNGPYGAPKLLVFIFELYEHTPFSHVPQADFYAHAENCPKQGSAIYRQNQMVKARQSERINKPGSHLPKLAWESDSLTYCRCFAPYDHLKEAKPSCPASQACALKKKLPEHVRKVSYGSSEKMEIAAKAAQRSALGSVNRIEGWFLDAHERQPALHYSSLYCMI